VAPAVLSNPLEFSPEFLHISPVLRQSALKEVPPKRGTFPEVIFLSAAPELSNLAKLPQPERKLHQDIQMFNKHMPAASVPSQVSRSKPPHWASRSGADKHHKTTDETSRREEQKNSPEQHNAVKNNVKQRPTKTLRPFSKPFEHADTLANMKN